eukprot:9062232-Lingulodinium_polyedra.AAC.1
MAAAPCVLLPLASAPSAGAKPWRAASPRNGVRLRWPRPSMPRSAPRPRPEDPVGRDRARPPGAEADPGCRPGGRP